ncbi:hypothetical protein AUC68_15285 [Methyloceanibacter methanicus]|uniref:Macro domain-containing protein n=1 Tax=Methyloceanibacter methanicus TaxID=1774968 RepID=A0A1E3W504_9HYPH|nr:hypothetical protein AUC68_15285 [Methyloceanibacter methanicus]
MQDRIEIVDADITRLAVDAIVNAANEPWPRAAGSAARSTVRPAPDSPARAPNWAVAPRASPGSPRASISPHHT